MLQYSILTTASEKDYELLDSGDGEKLERYGGVIVARPDPQALWPKSLSKEEWSKVRDLLDLDQYGLSKIILKKVDPPKKVNKKKKK